MTLKPVSLNPETLKPDCNSYGPASFSTFFGTGT